MAWTKKKLRFLLVILVGVLSCFAAWCLDDAIIHICVMWAFCIVAMASIKFELSHPFVWFSGGFTLYSTAYAMVYCMGLATNGYNKENVLYPMIAMLVALTAMGDKSYKVKDIDLNAKFPYKFVDVCSWILTALLFACVAALVLSGYGGKSEMKQANDPFYRIGVYCARYLTFFVLLKVCSSIKKKDRFKNGKLQILLFALPTLLFTLYTGERDAFIRFTVVIVFALFYLKIIKKRHFLILIPLFVLVMILSVYFKYYFSSGIINTADRDGGILYQFLKTDFISQGRNFQYLLNNPWTKGCRNYLLILTEMLYPFVPGGLFFNPDRWFNYEVHTGTFKGYAFTLVGTGYIIDGLLGVIVVFVVVGLFVRTIYKRSTHGIYGLCAYIYTITTVVFSFRESLNTLFVSTVRVVFLSIFLCRLACMGNKKRVK